MKIQVNFEKKHFYILLVLFAVFAGVIYVRGLANSVPPTPWHPLQEVAINNLGSTSVDSNANGAVDASDSAKVSDNTLGVQGQSVYWLGLGGANPQLCFDQGGTCGTQTATCSNTGSAKYYVDPGQTCLNAECQAACQTEIACNGDSLGGCSGGTTSSYTAGTCTGGQGSSCGKWCSCTCTNPQPATYTNEILVGAGRKCATFVAS